MEVRRQGLNKKDVQALTRLVKQQGGKFTNLRQSGGGPSLVLAF